MIIKWNRAVLASSLRYLVFSYTVVSSMTYKLRVSPCVFVLSLIQTPPHHHKVYIFEWEMEVYCLCFYKMKCIPVEEMICTEEEYTFKGRCLLLEWNPFHLSLLRPAAPNKNTNKLAANWSL